MVKFKIIGQVFKLNFNNDEKMAFWPIYYRLMNDKKRHFLRSIFECRASIGVAFEVNKCEGMPFTTFLRVIVNIQYSHKQTLCQYRLFPFKVLYEIRAYLGFCFIANLLLVSFCYYFFLSILLLFCNHSNDLFEIYNKKKF